MPALSTQGERVKTEEITGLLDIWIKYAPPFAATVFIAFAIAIYVLWRTGSAHMLRLRVWNLAYGKDVAIDERIRSFIEGRTSLMAFRYVSGVSMRSLESARRLVKWLEDNDEDVSTIALAGQYFDREELRLNEKLPSKHLLLFLIFSMTLAWVAFTATGTLWFTERGYFSVKESGKRFSATATDIQSIGLYLASDRTTLNSQRCSESPIPKGEFSDKEAQLLCSFLLDSEFKPFVESAVRAQRAFLTVLVVFFGIGFAFMVMKIRQADCVLEMDRRLKRRARQSSFDF